MSTQNSKNETTPPTAAGRRTKPDGEPGSPTRPIILGIVLILVSFTGLGTWAAVAPLDSAALAPGTVAVESNRKTIDHPHGGVVRRILVREGEAVEAGEVLLHLDPTEARASFDATRQKLDSAIARRARLIAERDGRDSPDFPAELTRRRDISATVRETIEGERNHFEARRSRIVGEVSLHRQRIAELHEEIAGLQAQQDSARTQIDIISDELVGLRQLYRKGYYPKTKLLAKERELARLEGEIGAKIAAIARARESIGEVRMTMRQVREEFDEQVVAELREVEDEIGEYRQHLIVNDDKLTRTEIRAPRDGIVQKLEVHTEGEVVRAGEEIMQVIPSDDRMVVVAEVSPQDIDIVAQGQSAEVRLTAFSSRTTPVLRGRVATLSADRIVDDKDNRAYYKARVEIPAGELAKLEGRELQAGMPAEVLISTGERTMLEYLIKPLSDAMARGLIEQ